MGSLAHTAGFSVSSRGPAAVYGEVDDTLSFNDFSGPYGSGWSWDEVGSAHLSGYTPGPNRLVANVWDADSVLDVGLKINGTGGSFSANAVHTDGFGWSDGLYGFGGYAYEIDALSASVGLDGPGRFRLDAHDVDFGGDGEIDFSHLTMVGKASAPATFSAGIFNSSFGDWSADGWSFTDRVGESTGGNASITLYEAGNASLRAVGVTPDGDKLVFKLGLHAGDGGGSVSASAIETVTDEIVYGSDWVSASHVETETADFSAYLPGGGHAEAVVADTHHYDYYLG